LQRQKPFGVIEEAATGIGQPEDAIPAIDQWYPEFLFQRCDAARYGGLVRKSFSAVREMLCRRATQTNASTKRRFKISPSGLRGWRAVTLTPKGSGKLR